MTRTVLALLACLIAVPAIAAEPGEDQRTARLDRLFDSLSKAQSPADAKRFTSTIEQLWMRSGSDTADLLASRAFEALKREDADLAIELLDNVVALQPDFAEAWNKRATLHYMRGDLARSMLDIRETLEREPRHWGAWSGLGRILEETGEKRQALQAYRRALAVNPQIEGLQERADRLAAELRGQDI